MAARDSASLSRNDYLALFYALQELRSEPSQLRILKSHISSGSFYNQPLPNMIRHMQILLQSKDPNRKFPQTLRKEDVPTYFESLLREVNSHTEHDFYGNIERGIKQNVWENIPSPIAAPVQNPAVKPLPEEAELPEQPETEEKGQESEKKAEPIKRFKAGSPHAEPEKATVPPKDQPLATTTQKKNIFQRVKSFFSAPSTPRPPTTTSPSSSTTANTRAIVAKARQSAGKILGNPAKNLGSQIVRQIIRHPLLKKRVVTAGIGAIGGYYFGGAPGAGVGAVLGGLLGPNISSSIGDVLTGGRNSSSATVVNPTVPDDTSGDPPSGGGGGSNFFRNRALNAARNLANQAARRALIAGGRTFLAANAWWIILVIVVGILLLVALLLMLCILPWSGCSTGGGDIKKNFSIQKSAPQAVDNGSPIEYKIEVTNKGNQNASVTVVDNLPDGTVYQTGNNDPATDQNTSKKIQWTINDLGPGQKKDLTFTVVPQIPDTWIVNQISANIKLLGNSSSGNVNIPGNIPPTADNCNGTYPLKNPLGNFGDPKCDFNKDALYQILQQLDPTNATYWFTKVARCESNYSPNAYADPIAVGTPDPIGAWGLFQMGRGKNGEFDHGDVIWQLQTSNAVNYNNNISKLGLAWRYWQCANDRW